MSQVYERQVADRFAVEIAYERALADVAWAAEHHPRTLPMIGEVGSQVMLDSTFTNVSAPWRYAIIRSDGWIC